VSSAVAEVETAPPLPPLTELERGIASELRERVQTLTGFGSRNVAEPLSYADATDWIAGQLEGMGFAVERQGFVVGDEVAQNLMVHTPGLRLGFERIVVVARVDSARGSVGADDNASGVVALMSLAQRYFGKRTQRTIDWVWLADAGGRAQPEAMGAVHFLKLATEKKASLRAMVEVHGLGAYNDAPGSQRYADALPGVGDSGNFIAWVSYPEHALISDHFGVAFGSRLSLPVQRFTGLSDNPPVPLGAQRAFLERGIPSLLVYDTQSLRYPDFGTPKDTAERLDYERMARVVVGLHDGISTLAGGFGEAPTPAAASPAAASPAAASPDAASP
jgi:Peptidase family M28